MSCPYSEEKLEKWEDVANPMSSVCDECDDCECIHWIGTCVGCEQEYCPDPDRAIAEAMSIDELPQT